MPLQGAFLMKPFYFSIVIPVFNRPDEIDRLLQSLTFQDDKNPFEVVVVEDGSTLDAKQVCDKYSNQLEINYYFKSNSGPGDSRNYGMSQAKGNYFLILDSDCVLPSHYLSTVCKALSASYTDCFGGADAAHDSFTFFQKAVNAVMTNPFSTGGVRGAKKGLTRFQPRSFNMGVSKQLFDATGGFGKIHPGEDPEFVFRAWDLGFKTRFVDGAEVFHERRIRLNTFVKQIYKFGSVRVILNRMHPKYQSRLFLLPSVFTAGWIILITLLLISFLFNLNAFHLDYIYGGISLYLIYSVLFFANTWYRSKSFRIAVVSVPLMFIQFASYAYGYIRSSLKLIGVSNDRIQVKLPEFFFKDIA
jgi:glycosyltransferase involved in cell wall biosynthesis